MLALFDDAEGAACRGIVIAGNAVAVLRDDRPAPLQPFLVALGGARLFRVVFRLRHCPDIRIAGGPTRSTQLTAPGAPTQPPT